MDDQCASALLIPSQETRSWYVVDTACVGMSSCRFSAQPAVTPASKMSAQMRCGRLQVHTCLAKCSVDRQGKQACQHIASMAT